MHLRAKEHSVQGAPTLQATGSRKKLLKKTYSFQLLWKVFYFSTISIALYKHKSCPTMDFSLGLKRHFFCAEQRSGNKKEDEKAIVFFFPIRYQNLRLSVEKSLEK